MPLRSTFFSILASTSAAGMKRNSTVMYMIMMTVDCQYIHCQPKYSIYRAPTETPVLMVRDMRNT